ncbi:MAG: potassium channel family protein [Cyclobacteriaceae bacterium]
MTPLLFIIGLCIVVLTILDILYTVLAPNGAGYLAGKITFYIWRISLKIAGYDHRSKLLCNVGPYMLLLIVQIWVLLIWVGNAIIIYSDPHSLYNSTQQQYQEDFISNLYFSGYVLSAMGHGDYSPSNGWWKAYTAFISFTGVVFITLAISYLLPVIQAVTDKRTLSLRISSFGNSPEDILKKNWKNDHFEYLVKELKDLKPAIFSLAQQHMAYPIIHYFHSKDRNESAPINIATVDETLTILRSLLKDNSTESTLINDLVSTQSAITYFLSTLKSGHIKPGNDEPEVPGLDYINDFDLPERCSVEEIKSTFRKHRKRRKLLLAYIQNDAWKWEDVVSDNDDISLE